MFLDKTKSKYTKAYYVTELEETPNHIKYRYYANLSDGEVTTIGLECVTKIGDEYVSFKDIFKVNPATISQKHAEIKDHVDLFLSILKSPSKAVVYE